MGQHGDARLLPTILLLLVALTLTCSCDRAKSPPAAPCVPPVPAARPAIPASAPTIASVVPSATDIIFQLNAQDHLVGISNFEPATPQLAAYDRVGDYHVIDWEKLSGIRPATLVIQRPSKELADVFRQRARALNIQLIDIHVDRLNEIFPMIDRLGRALNEPAKAQALAVRLRDQLAGVAARSAGKPPVRTLLALDEHATYIVGPRNFLDDLLTLAGGVNVAADLAKDYPTIDRENLLRLDPNVVIQLLPDAPPQVVAAARDFWASLPQLNAVRNHQIYIYTDSYLLFPSARVGDLADRMVNILHPLDPLTNPPPATTTSPK